MRPERAAAAAAWGALPLPRPAMTALAGSAFAFDWPPDAAAAVAPPRCNLCGALVRERRAVGHLDAVHPGWLERQNARLRREGVVL